MVMRVGSEDTTKQEKNRMDGYGGGGGGMEQEGQRSRGTEGLMVMRVGSEAEPISQERKLGSGLEGGGRGAERWTRGSKSRRDSRVHGYEGGH